MVISPDVNSDNRWNHWVLLLTQGGGGEDWHPKQTSPFEPHSPPPPLPHPSDPPVRWASEAEVGRNGYFHAIHCSLLQSLPTGQPSGRRSDEVPELCSLEIPIPTHHLSTAAFTSNLLLGCSCDAWGSRRQSEVKAAVKWRNAVRPSAPCALAGEGPWEFSAPPNLKPYAITYVRLVDVHILLITQNFF